MNSINYSVLIEGAWTQTKKNKDNVGVAIERIEKNGTKTSEVVLFNKNPTPSFITATSTWKIDGNILTEKLTSINDEIGKQAGIKKGDERSYIIEFVNDVELHLKPLLEKGASKVIYYRVNHHS